MLRRLASILAPVLAAVGIVAAGPPATAATLPTAGFAAHAYGSLVNLGDGTLRSGPTSLAAIACTTVSPKEVHGTAAQLTLPQVGTIGPVSTVARTFTTTTARNSAATSKVTGLNLLGGKVTADTIGSSTVARLDSAGRVTSGHSSTILGLVVNGQAIPGSAPPNTQIPLESGGTRYGTVWVNQQGRTLVGNELRAVTSALVITFSGTNPLGIPSGTRIEVGTSRAYMTQPVTGVVGGAGYTSNAVLGTGAVVSSPQALAYAPCSGGTAYATVATVSIPDVGSTGTTETHATSRVSATSRYVAVWNDTADVSLFGGALKAKAVNARTAVTQTGTTTPGISDTSGFVGLQLAGAPAVTDTVKPNTVVDVPGLGKVTFHKVGRTTQAIQLTMIEVVLSVAQGSLPAGSVVRIGYSYSALR